MSGRLAVVGLGPGAADLVAPRAAATLAAASDLFRYGPYVARVPERAGQRRHISDNREELQRAREALALAAGGASVAVVSSGDPGVFAMAAAVFEAIEHGDPAWRSLEIELVPGISAMLATAARLGAPLGHDFCVLSLSDNLKPWDLVEKRLRLAAEADLVIALYNPISKARPWQLGRALEVLRQVQAPATPVVFATAVSRGEERIVHQRLGEADPAQADMRTLVLVGSSATRLLARPAGEPWLYTPRAVAVSA